MAKKQNWQDDYWLLVMQLYLRKPVGVKPMYSRDSIFLCLELHIAPEVLFSRQCEVANLETPRIERIWEEYGRNPKLRPLEGEERLLPISLVLILELYFRLTPNTMVAETPEVRDLASLMKVPTRLIVEVLDIFQHCDPYLHRRDVIVHPLFAPCMQIWERYGNVDNRKLVSYATQLKAYYL